MSDSEGVATRHRYEVSQNEAAIHQTTVANQSSDLSDFIRRKEGSQFYRNGTGTVSNQRSQ